MSLILSETLPSGVRLWTINRPEKRNAMSMDLFYALREVVSQVTDDVKAVVLTGKGEFFCAGLDLETLRSLSPDNVDKFVSAASTAYEELMTCPAPTIAAIRGAALAGGFDIAAMCDLRVSTPDAKFGQLEARLGIPGLTEPHWRIMGLARAKESAFTASIYDGTEALRIGFVNHLADDPLAYAISLAETIAANGTRAVRAMKASAGGWPIDEVRQALRHQMEVFGRFLKEPETIRGIAEYVSKRR